MLLQRFKRIFEIRIEIVFSKDDIEREKNTEEIVFSKDDIALFKTKEIVLKN